VIEAKEKVKQIQANILAAQSRQKSYTDKRRSPLEFEVGDHVYLRVSPMKGVHCFGIKGKLAPRYIGLYLSYPVPRNRERSLHTCAQDVQITRMATI
jgi:hypothetical protein